MRKELSNLKDPSFCMESNTSLSPCYNRIFRGGSYNSLETGHHKQTSPPSASAGDSEILPNCPEDEKVTDSNNTKRDRCMSPVGNERNRQQEKQVPSKSKTSLNMCNKQLSEVPDSILTMHNIMYLYLANNKIAILPDEFFDYFPRLRWLDLRYNCLTHLPSNNPDGHNELRCLLIEGNAIRKLPLELGFMYKLHGLNICNNPIEFPPSHIIMKGTREILKYLHDIYIQENQANDDSISCKVNKDNEKRDNSSPEIPHHDNQNEETTFDLEHTGMNNEPKQNSEIQGKHELTSNRIAQQAKEVLHKLALRKSNMKIEKILQHKKDQESLKKFQNDYKQKQEKSIGLNIEIPDQVATAPYTATSDCMKMLSHKDIGRAPEENRPLPDVVSHKTKMKLCKLREIKMEELEEKIKSHYLKMHQRKKQVHKSVIDEVTAIKKDLDEAKHLQNELEVHRQDLEYRFKAFIGDISNNSPNTQ